MAENFMNTTAASSTAVALNTAAKGKKARAAKGKKAQNVTIDHAVMIEAPATTSDGAELDALLAELGIDSTVEGLASSDEVMIESPVAEAVELMTDASLLEAAVGNAEATELMIASATPDTDDGSAPSGVGSDVVSEPEAAIDAAAAPKKERTPRKHYSDKVERLKDRMGASLSEYAVLTTADALVDDAELGAVMERTLDIIRAMNSKEKNRASGFIEFLSGKKSKLNNVLERVLGVLEKDGFIQTGNEGNVFLNLIARPYSPASARAMGGNTIGVFADLKVILPLEGHKGRFVANPDSLLLAKARSLLAAAPAASGTDEEGEGDESAE